MVLIIVLELIVYRVFAKKSIFRLESGMMRILVLNAINQRENEKRKKSVA